MYADDPVVERVREARRRIAEECGNDMNRIYEWAKRIEAEHADRVVGYEAAKKGTNDQDADEHVVQ